MFQAHWSMETKSATSDIMVPPSQGFCQTLIQYDITIVKYDVTIVAPC